MFSCTTATSPRSTKVRRARLLLAATAIGATALSTPGAASAAPAGPSSPVPTSSPVSFSSADAHSMGSTVAAREGASTTASVTAGTIPAGVPGLDVSRWQGNVDWTGARADGARFAYVKATESTSYTNPYFKQQYNGSYASGMIRGAYHFALPDRSSGTAQADWFVSHGGGWSPDGRTLPPLLDIEYNPYGSTCYGLTPTQMVSWIRSFSSRVKVRTGRYPAIYTTTSWWAQCTANNSSFAATHPLFIARYASTVGTLPAGWTRYTFWQYADAGRFPGDQDTFNGSMTRLRALARGQR